MVCDWSPEPPRDVDDHISLPSQVMLAESDESEDEMLGNAPPGYELLPQGPVLGPSSDEEAESETEAVNGAASLASSNPVVEVPCTSAAMARRASEVEETDSLYSATSLRPELNVDCDQVRAAMVGFSLPPSSIPPWAANIPETQLATLLSQQIQRIQGNSSNT